MGGAVLIHTVGRQVKPWPRVRTVYTSQERNDEAAPKKAKGLRLGMRPIELGHLLNLEPRLFWMEPTFLDQKMIRLDAHEVVEVGLPVGVAAAATGGRARGGDHNPMLSR